MSISDLLKKLDFIDVGKKANKNKVTLQQVVPSIEDKSLLYRDSVFIAVSLGSLAFLNKKFSAIMKFMQKFKSTVLYICDTPYEYTLQMQQGLSPMESIEIAQLIANQTMVHQEEVCRRENLTSPKFISHSELEVLPEYLELYSYLNKLHLDNIHFQILVEEFSQFYLARIENKIRCTEEQAKMMSQKYLLAELTASGTLNIKGYRAMIYPGKIDSISGLLDIQLPDNIASYYKDFRFISLRNNRKKN